MPKPFSIFLAKIYAQQLLMVYIKYSINEKSIKILLYNLDIIEIFLFCAESTGKVAVLVGQGGVAGGKSLGAAVAMLGKDGDYFTPGTQGVIRFNQISKTRYIFYKYV